MNQKGIMGDV